MIAAVTSASRYLAPLLLGLSAMLAAGNWYLEPAHAWRWAAALLLLVGMALVLWLALDRSPRPDAPGHAAASIRHSIVFAAIMMAVPLSVKLAHALGAADATDLAQRLTMAVVGAFFVVTGNALPKMLTPLSALRCDAARVQAMQRFAGWTFVLTGLAFAVVWLVLPHGVAQPISISLIAGGALAVMARTTRPRRTRHEEA